MKAASLDLALRWPQQAHLLVVPSPRLKPGKPPQSEHHHHSYSTEPLSSLSTSTQGPPFTDINGLEEPPISFCGRTDQLAIVYAEGRLERQAQWPVADSSTSADMTNADLLEPSLSLVGSIALILDHQFTPDVAKADTPDADWLFPGPGSFPRSVYGLAPGESPIHCHGLRCH